MSSINIELHTRVFNKVYVAYLEDTHRYLIFYGGAGSGKSFFIAEYIIYHLLKENSFNLLVVRNTGKSNRDSTYALLKQVIRKWNLSKLFKINESDLRIKCLINNNEVIFAGLDDVEKLKSITFTDGELTTIWIEEASEISEADFNQLDIRLRGKGTKKQIIISFNPVDINHWLKKRFFDRQDDNIQILHTTYKDNRFLDEEYKKLLESYKDTDEYYYNVYCLGQWGILGKTVFDAKKLSDRLQAIPKPLRTGYFTYDYDGIKITNIKWQEDKNGYIKIYNVPDSPQITQYVIGGDTAGDGSDYFTAHVLDACTGMQVATMKNQFDADLYAKQMYCLGKYYKDALISIEANFDSFPIRELQRLGYLKQYVREQIDSYTGRTEKKFGFKTTQITRPVIISNLIELVREHTELINDRETIEELLTIIRNEKGRIEAPVGGHDDMMMGLAIAHESRNQVVIDRRVIQMRQDTFFKDNTIKEKGEKIIVI